MALLVEKTTSGREYKVKDMSQADFGRLQIELRSCNIFSTQEHAAAAIARDSAAVFAWKCETLQEYWWCTERALDWGPGGGPDLIMDDGGDITLLIHEGVKAEEIYEKTGQFPNPDSTENVEFKIVLSIIKEGLKTDPKRYHKMKDRLVGVLEESTTGVKNYQMQANGTLLFPAINFNDLVTKSKFDNLHGCRHSLPDGLMTATDVMIAGNKDIIMDDHMKKMKNNAIVCNIGHFDNKTDKLGLETDHGVKHITIKPQTDRDNSTGYITFEVHLLSAEGLKVGNNCFSNGGIYTINTVLGDCFQKLKARSSVDRDGGTDPFWNCSMKFIVKKDLVLKDKLTFRTTLLSERSFGSDKVVSMMNAPLKELFDKAVVDGESFQRDCYELTTTRGKHEGTIYLSYRFLMANPPGEGYEQPQPVPVQEGRRNRLGLGFVGGLIGRIIAEILVQEIWT